MDTGIPDTSRSAFSDDKIISALINEFLDTLTQDKCDMFVKRYRYGESIEQIAKEMGFTNSKVKTHTSQNERRSKKIFRKERGITMNGLDSRFAISANRERVVEHSKNKRIAARFAIGIAAAIVFAIPASAVCTERLSP